MRVSVFDFLQPRWRDLLLLGLIGLVAFLPGLAALPPVDRDEARYMQATVQMVETGDVIDIRFQDDARHKKPAGAHWAQLGSLALTGQLDDVRRGERAAWAHRLPSVLGALIAVWATYLAGVVLFGRREALLGAGFLAVSVSLVFEAHIAKTDAMLAGAAAVVLYGIVAKRAWTVWLALAAGVLIKGPVIIGVAGLALGVDAALSRSLDRVRPLAKPLPVLAAIALAAPWFVAIGLKTDGAFFAEALGRDFGGKIAGAQETHGGPPGYYALTTLAMFWPGVMALPVAAVFAWRERPSPAVRLLLAWVLPMWLVLEFVPTKLPHYTLPLYPALALLAGAAWVRTGAPKTKLAGAAVAAGLGVLLGAGVAYASLVPQGIAAILIVTPVLVALSIIASHMLRLGRDKAGLVAAALFIGLGFGTLARSPLLNLSPRVAAIGADGARLVSPDYREPSLVFLAGTDTGLTRAAQVGDRLAVSGASTPPGCAAKIGEVSGTNYAKGRELTLSVFSTEGCTQAELDRWAAP